MSYKTLNYTIPSKGYYLGVHELPKSVGADELLVKVSYAAINPVDVILFNGAGLQNLLRRELGFGHEFSGKVELIGAHEEKFKKGDSIVAITKDLSLPVATVGEYVHLKKGEWSLAKVPENVEMADAASIPLSFMSALDMIERHKNISSSSKVLILGGGTMAGYFCIQLLRKVYKVHDVLSVQSSSTDNVYLEKLGYTPDSVNYDKNPDTVSGIEEYIKQKFNGEKFDLVLDTVGGTEVLYNMSKIAKMNGGSQYITIVGDKVSDYNGSFFKNIKMMIMPYIRNIGYKWLNYGFSYEIFLFESTSEKLEKGMELLSSGEIKTRIDSVHSLERYQDAIDKLNTHHAKGKVLIKSYF